MLWVGSTGNFCKLTVVSDQWNRLNAFYEKKKMIMRLITLVFMTPLLLVSLHPHYFCNVNGSCMDVDIIFWMGANGRANLVRVRKKDQNDAFWNIKDQTGKPVIL